MSDNVAKLREEAERARRLVLSATDVQTIADLKRYADECEVKADGLELVCRMAKGRPLRF